MKAAEERFWVKVDKTETCWLWTAATSRNGYGDFWDGTKHPSGTNRIVRAHRYAYELLVGPIPADREIDHICHQRNCVNPDHLRLATRKQQLENTAAIRGISGVRGVTRDKGGHAWRVRVMHNGVSHYGGTFADLGEAEAVAIRMRNDLFTHNDLDRTA